MGPRQVFIDVYIESVTPSLKFHVEPSPVNNPPLLTGPNGIIFRNDHHAGFDIYFQLQGNTFGYYFPNDKHEAVWSQKGSVCPSQGVWDILKPVKVFDPPYPIPPRQRTTLWAKNPNPGPAPGQGRFQYNLRVTDGTNWLELDPGGDNMNGPQELAFDFSAMLIGIVSAVLTAAALIGAAYLTGLQLVLR